MQPNPWLLAKSSLKYFLVKFLKLEWLPHYSDWEPHVMNSPRSDHQAHRGSGKSIFWSFGVPLWDVIRGPDEMVDPEDVLISYSEDQVRRLLRNIRVEVETNEFLSSLRPSTKETWGTDQLSFPNGYLISGVGFGTSSRGKHPRRIIIDDPLKDLGGMNQEDQERTYFGVISGMAMERTQIHAIGTPMAFGDLFQKLEFNSAYKHTKHPAYRKDGSIQCPYLFSEALLKMKQAEMGSINFAREMLLERIDPNTQLFKRDFETLYDELPSKFSHTATVCDPAYTENDGDYTAIMTAKFTHGNHAYVAEAKRFRRSDMGIIVNELFKTIERQEPDVVGIPRRKGEALSFAFNDRRIRENRWDFKVVELAETQGKAGKTRIGGLVPRWEARAIHVHRHMKELLEEFYQFREDDSHHHDDMLDALAHCFNPEMVNPSNYRRSIPTRTQQVGRPLYRVGNGISHEQPDLYEPLWKRLDRRVYDEVAA